MKRSTRRWLIGVSLVLVAIAVLAAIKVAQIRTMIATGKAQRPPPESVTTAVAERQGWRETTNAVGSLVAVRDVTLGAEVIGTVRTLSFEAGTAVKRGDLLVRLDTSSEAAQLQSAVADQNLAHVTLRRVQSLTTRGAAAPAEADTARARAQQADALVDNLRAMLAKKVIRAPFDGLIGIKQVELGQVLSPGTPIATLTSVNPIYAEFWLGQDALASLREGQDVAVRSATFGDETWRGTITTINAQVDPETRNVRVRATVPNHDGRLRAGMFVTVDVLAPSVADVIVVPATSVVFAPYGDSVFVVEQKDGPSGPEAVARQRFVRIGERRGDFVAVASGLKPGESIVSNGAFKLRNGASVVTNNELAPRAELVPTPREQ